MEFLTLILVQTNFQKFINYGLGFLTLLLVPVELSVPVLFVLVVSCDSLYLSTNFTKSFESGLLCDLNFLMELRIVVYFHNLRG